MHSHRHTYIYPNIQYDIIYGEILNENDNVSRDILCNYASTITHKQQQIHVIEKKSKKNTCHSAVCLNEMMYVICDVLR